MKPPPSKIHVKFGFTLVEMVIAMTLLAVLMTSGVVVVNHVSRLRQQVEMKEYLYTEMQAILERMARTIQSSGIDYEEYYSRGPGGSTGYGANPNAYHAEFFSGSYEKFQNPAIGSEMVANALCDGGASCSSTIDYHQVDELYLISKSGDHRTYYALETESDGGNAQIALLELSGSDTDADGIINSWSCETSPAYACTGTPTADATDLLDGIDNDNFIPISPSSITIDSLQFYISPIEDPYKGILETNTVYESVQIHPRVTMVLSAHYEGTFPLIDPPSITLQTTVGTGVYTKHDTYAP